MHDPASGDAIPAVPPPRSIAPGVLEIDTMLGGWERVTAGYLIEGPAPVLIETGSQTSVPVLLAALDQIGVGPAELAGIAVTHIHLDHAGGVGDVARAFPSATVYVHEKGARHLADPTRLIDSAARVYGPLLDSLYGRLDPTPPERLHVLDDGEEIDGRDRGAPWWRWTRRDTPSTMSGLHDSVSGVLFAGDAVGVKLPDGGVLRPATPPPDFDLDQALTSLAKFAARRPSGDRFGALRPARRSPRNCWRRRTRRCGCGPRRPRGPIAKGRTSLLRCPTASTRSSVTSTPAHKEKLETLNGVHSNAAGFRRWLEGRGAAPAP